MLVIDEAHLLDHAPLESIRMLTTTISIPPARSPVAHRATDLRRRMKLGALAALDQRIGLRYAMPPMTVEETASYLRHHLALAERSDTLLSDDATALIHQASRDYQRAVNNIAVQALVPPSPQKGHRRGEIRPQRRPRSPQNDHHSCATPTTNPPPHRQAPSGTTPTEANHVADIGTANDAIIGIFSGGQQSRHWKPIRRTLVRSPCRRLP